MREPAPLRRRCAPRRRRWRCRPCRRCARRRSCRAGPPVSPNGRGSGSAKGRTGASAGVGGGRDLGAGCRRRVPRRAGPARRHEAGGEHAVDLAVARRCGAGESRIAGECEFDCGRRELATDVGGVGIADDAAQQRAGAPPRCRRRADRCGPASTRSSAGLTVRPASSCRRTRSALASMSKPVSTKVISLRKPPIAVQRDLQRRRRRLTLHAVDPHPVGAVVGQPIVSTRSVTSGFGVSRAGDLVEQLGGDRADADRTAGARDAW